MLLSAINAVASLQHVTLATVLFSFLYAVVYYFRDGLAHIPSIHWSVRWSRCHALCTKYFWSTKLDYLRAHIGWYRYQPLMRVAPNEVSIMTLEGIKIAWGGGFERSSWYEAFANFGVLNMFSFSSSRAHNQRRRILASAYSKHAIAQSRVQKLITERTAKLLSFVDRQTSTCCTTPGESGPIVIRNLFRALQADIFTAFAFSEEHGTDFLANLGVGANSIEDLGLSMLDLCHDEKRDAFSFWETEKPFKYIWRWIDQNGLRAHQNLQIWLVELATKFEATSNPNADHNLHDDEGSGTEKGVYGKLLQWRDPTIGRQLSIQERASEIMDHIVAGQDAVPAALEFIIRKLSTHQHIQANLRLELQSGAAEPRHFAMIDNMIYLDAVVMEGLRLVDTISSYQTRVVPNKGCVISGIFLPAGTVLSAQPYLINRLADNFPNPDAFDPNRWCVSSGDYRALARKLWTYASGPTSCIGRELSLAIIKTVIAEIYFGYTTRLVNEDRTERRPWEGANKMAEVQFSVGPLLPANAPRAVGPLREVRSPVPHLPSHQRDLVS